jgi:exopolysaccharide biosynthesis polyprenyl glycosylphosphotransferase
MRSAEPSEAARGHRETTTTVPAPRETEGHARSRNAISGAGATAVQQAVRAPWTLLSRLGVPPLLIALDGLAVAVGVLGMEVVSREVGLDSPARKTAAFGAVLIVLLWQAGLYRPRLSLSVLDDLPRILGRWLAAAALAVLGQIAWSQALWRDYVINWAFLFGAVTTGVAVVGLRVAGYGLVRRLRSRGLVQHRTVIVGAGRVGAQVAEILQAHPEYGLHPIGFLDDDPPEFDSILPLPVLGGAQSLTAVLQERQVNNVVVAFSSMKESEMVSVIRTSDRFDCELFLVPRLFELHQVDTTMDAAWGFPLVRLRRATYRSPAWRVKRLLDVLVSGLAILLIAPLLLVLAVAVRLDGGPGILFRQERVGVDGRHFDVLKFRSMRPVDETESATNWSIAQDDRVSRLGRFLRMTSLDELPQLFNILRGDMSLVGPRPERPYFVDQLVQDIPFYAVRHSVKPGVTGWAQVSYQYGASREDTVEKLQYDLYYVKNHSLFLDLVILFETIGVVLTGKGAH